MPVDNNIKSAFLNRRDWGSYVSALQNAATHPKVLDAMKCSRDWFAKNASEASSWLVGTTEASWLVGSTKLRDKFSAG